MSKSRNSADPTIWVLVVYYDYTSEGDQFEEESIVPVHWLSNSQTKLWWPDSNIIENKLSMIPSCDGWSSYRVKKVKFSGKLSGKVTETRIQTINEFQAYYMKNQVFVGL